LILIVLVPVVVLVLEVAGCGLRVAGARSDAKRCSTRNAQPATRNFNDREIASFC